MAETLLQFSDEQIRRHLSFNIGFGFLMLVVGVAFSLLPKGSWWAYGLCVGVIALGFLVDFVLSGLTRAERVHLAKAAPRNFFSAVYVMTCAVMFPLMIGFDMPFGTLLFVALGTANIVQALVSLNRIDATLSTVNSYAS